MKALHLIVVGKLKDKNLIQLEDNYLKRINSPKLQIHEVKSCEERLEEEATLVIKKIESLGGGQTILLSEHAKQFDSPKFSLWLSDQLEIHQNIFFVIGGASGHGEKIKKKSDFSISLGEMTYPHKLARLLFIEQIYRAETIRLGHPYHK